MTLKCCHCAQNQNGELFEEKHSDLLVKLPPPPIPRTPLFVELTEEDKVLGNSLQLEELNVCCRSKIYNIWTRNIIIAFPEIISEGARTV